MRKVVNDSSLFARNHYCAEEIVGKRRIKVKILLTLLIFVVTQSFYTNYAENRKYSCFLITVNEFRDNPKQVSSFINQLLQLDYNIYRCAQKKEVDTITINPGDFIVDEGSSKRKILFTEYLRSENIIEGKFVNIPLDVELYPLKKGKVAVYDGNYAQDGANLHVKTLIELGFDVRLMGDDDLFDGKLTYPEYIAVILPGLGGEGGSVWYSPGITGKEELQKFVKSGGGIFGTCAGAGIIVEKNNFYDEMPSFYLNLAPISHTVTFRGWGLVKVKSLDKENPLFYGLGETFYMLHAGGGGMHALNNNAKPVEVYSNLDRFGAKPWACNYFNWDAQEKSFKKDTPPKTEKEARKWLEPYLNKPNYASTIVAKNGKGRVVATGNHPEILAQMEEGSSKRVENVYFRRKDITGGYIYEANVIYFLTQGEREKIELKPITFDLKKGDFLSNKRSKENVFKNEYLTLVNEAEKEINELNFLIKDVEDIKNDINIGSWDAVLRETNRLENIVIKFKKYIKITQKFEIKPSKEETDNIKKDFTIVQKQFKEAKKYLLYIKNAVSAINYVVKQKEKVKGQHGLNYSADDKEEGWTVTENYLKTYLSNITSCNKNVDYVFGALSKSPGYTLNMLLHDIKIIILARYQEYRTRVLRYKFNNLVIN